MYVCLGESVVGSEINEITAASCKADLFAGHAAAAVDQQSLARKSGSASQ
jgi:hypothetical protein